MNLPHPYSLRPASPGDIPFLNGIELASARRLSVDVLPEPLRSQTVPQEALREGMAAGMLWVAAAGRDVPVGYCLLQRVHGLALLAQMDVAEEHGRRGLGRALVQKAALRARELGFGWLYLTTFAHIPWNAPFYASMGFVRIPEPKAAEAMADLPGAAAGLRMPETDAEGMETDAGGVEVDAGGMATDAPGAATELPAVMRDILAEERRYLQHRIAMRKGLQGVFA